MEWFFRFKLHLICNEKGELLNFIITPGDVDERNHWNTSILSNLSMANWLRTKGTSARIFSNGSSRCHGGRFRRWPDGDGRDNAIDGMRE